MTAPLTIATVAAGSIADKMGIEPGDRLLKADGHILEDLIDYSYYASSRTSLLLELEKPDGELWELEIEREPEDPLGCTFIPQEPARCSNNCMFCFVHQLPPGLRPPLYVKDEDYSLSFLNGNYVTLANLTPTQLQRILRLRLSPLYLSVHATDPLLREKLLGKTGIPPILEQIKALADGGILMHTQVVLCPGINDGAALEKTVFDLAVLFPAVSSLAIVPVGLTQHRDGLPCLRPVERDYAQKFVKKWNNKAFILYRNLGKSFLHLADEFYLKAGVPFPSIFYYGDFPQIENGVGMALQFIREAKKVLRSAKPLGTGKFTVVTGILPADIIEIFAKRLGEKTDLEIVSVGVPNHLFGESVTVSGLVAGNDIIAALQGKDVGRALLIPDVMLKEGEGLFLDDLSVTDMEERLQIPVIPFESTPAGFYKTLQEQMLLAKTLPIEASL